MSSFRSNPFLFGSPSIKWDIRRDSGPTQILGLPSASKGGLPYMMSVMRGGGVRRSSITLVSAVVWRGCVERARSRVRPRASFPHNFQTTSETRVTLCQRVGGKLGNSFSCRNALSEPRIAHIGNPTFLLQHQESK